MLNYTVTSNHIPLLVYDSKGEQNLSKSLQLIAGKTAQRYNQGRNRHGAFWEDRYHATAVESGEHLMRCMVYKVALRLIIDSIYKINSIISI